MADRRQRKEQAREERLAREEAAAASVARKRRLWMVGLAVAALAVAGVVLAFAGGGGSDGDAGGTKSSGSGVEAGLREGPAPWPPEYDNLAERLQALNLPGPSDTVFHHHAVLRIYVDGKPVEVEDNIGIDPGGRFLSPLHTHDDSGIVHVESDRPYEFTLGQFFVVWGVRFTEDRIGGYQATDGKQLDVYVNGKEIAAAPAYVMKRHDRIVVGYGRPGSFPTRFDFTFPRGL